MANPLVGEEFQVLPAEGMRVAIGEIGEGHLVGAANSCLKMMDLRREAMRWQPFTQSLSIQKGPIDAFGRSTNHAMQSHGSSCHWWSSSDSFQTSLPLVWPNAVGHR